MGTAAGKVLCERQMSKNVTAFIDQGAKQIFYIGNVGHKLSLDREDKMERASNNNDY